MASQHDDVFHKLRVATDLPSATGHPVTVVFNGVCANSWLSPIGISNKKQSSDIKQQLVIPSRPQTTGSIAIIRHHPKPFGLEACEVVFGKQLIGNSKDVPKIISAKTSVSCKRPVPFETENIDVNDRFLCKQNPNKKGFKGGGFCDNAKRLRPQTSRSYRTRTSQVDKPISLELNVTSLELPGEKHVDGRKHYRIGERYARHLQQHDNVDSYKYMSKTCFRRAQSAPPATRQGQARPGTTGPSLYWRAKSAYHRRLMTPSTDSDADAGDVTQVARGSMLRPLMYNANTDIQHSAGCPYKCKGCFKACLVSADYLENERNKQMKCTKDYRHRSFAKKDPRFILHQALARNQPIYKLVHGHCDEQTVKEAWEDGATIRGNENESPNLSVLGDRGLSTIGNTLDDLGSTDTNEVMFDDGEVDVKFLQPVRLEAIPTKQQYKPLLPIIDNVRVTTSYPRVGAKSAELINTNEKLKLKRRPQSCSLNGKFANMSVGSFNQRESFDLPNTIMYLKQTQIPEIYGNSSKGDANDSNSSVGVLSLDTSSVQRSSIEHSASELSFHISDAEYGYACNRPHSASSYCSASTTHRGTRDLQQTTVKHSVSTDSTNTDVMSHIDVSVHTADTHSIVSVEETEDRGRNSTGSGRSDVNYITRKRQQLKRRERVRSGLAIEDGNEHSENVTSAESDSGTESELKFISGNDASLDNIHSANDTDTLEEREDNESDVDSDQRHSSRLSGRRKIFTKRKSTSSNKSPDNDSDSEDTVKEEESDDDSNISEITTQLMNENHHSSECTENESDSSKIGSFDGGKKVATPTKCKNSKLGRKALKPGNELSNDQVKHKLKANKKQKKRKIKSEKSEGTASRTDSVISKHSMEMDNSKQNKLTGKKRLKGGNVKKITRAASSIVESDTGSISSNDISSRTETTSRMSLSGEEAQNCDTTDTASNNNDNNKSTDDNSNNENTPEQSDSEDDDDDDDNSEVDDSD